MKKPLNSWDYLGIRLIGQRMKPRNLIDAFYGEIAYIEESVDRMNPFPCSLKQREKINFQERIDWLIEDEGNLVMILTILAFTEYKMVERYARTTLQKLHRVKRAVWDAESAVNQKRRSKC